MSCPEINLPVSYDIAIWILALALGLFYGIWGREALDYPLEGSKKDPIKTAARIHVFLYHSLGGLFGVLILGYLFKNICINNQQITSMHLLTFVLGFMGTMGYLPRFISILNLDPEKNPIIKKFFQ